jgi:hypothetical protein
VGLEGADGALRQDEEHFDFAVLVSPNLLALRHTWTTPPRWSTM